MVVGVETEDWKVTLEWGAIAFMWCIGSCTYEAYCQAQLAGMIWFATEQFGKQMVIGFYSG